MQQSKQEVHSYKGDDIDLRALFNCLVAGRFLIAGLTGFGTVIAILYVLMLPPTPIYKATSTFTSPTTMSVISSNRLNLTDQTKVSIFSKFLTHLSSKKLQKEVFVKGDFITRFNKDNSPIYDVDEFISGTTESLRVFQPVTLENKNLGSSDPEYSVTIEGTNAEVISEYLNSLVDLANARTINELIGLNELLSVNRIEEISIERNLLLEKVERNRLNQIKRIKEDDGQKIRQINDQIDRARYKAKQSRLSQIAVLRDSARLARSLGVIDNNFKLFEGNSISSDLTIAIGEYLDLPEWYVYGEKALLQRIDLLESRTNDDPFIPELVTLNNALNEIQNNNLLKTLETRINDSPFVAEIVKLDIEVIKLEKSRELYLNPFNAMRLNQISLTPSIPINEPNIRLTVLLAFISSFMISIFLVLIMGALKPDEKTLA